MDFMRTPTFSLWVTVSCLFLSSITAGQQGCPFDSKVTWIPFRSKWYTFIPTSGNGYNLEKAQEICKTSAPGADVVSVRDKEENAFIVDHFKQLVQKPGEIWLGILFDTDKTQSRQWKTVYCDEELGKSIICDTTVLAVPDEDACSNGNKNILSTALVITASAILLIILLVSWYAYKRKCLSPNGLNAIQYDPTERITDDCILVENEEMEYEV
ncbi:CD302 antigen-like isoform X3 [Callorhinchus milii]|uniref:CD302 antigen-like isoform X3 n=1 Tax=Callorhinchus milii TaxID=7868 RepID=UPI001C3FC41D|nr:CD302 antigen-like isoform X3 [Callorhinchus milii]